MIPLYDENPTERKPVLTVGLIVACVLVFLWHASLGEREGMRMVYALGLIPAVLLGEATLPAAAALVPPEVTLVTSMFLHGGWMHLIGNMLYLWIFGNNIEDTLGRPRFALFYLGSGLAAAAAQIAVDPASTIPMIGASGAISGVLGAYLVLHPFARVVVLVPLGWFLYLARLPAFVVLGFWFVFQLLSAAVVPAGGGGVAWWAHIGGFVAGIVLLPLVRPGSRRRGPRG
jgi:membrane associated rhomboid family serine protease